ncbi:MAG: hypothetical protein JWL76_2147 [Thermoleophilia bacterium]|nr:hypothetical protein [Thermoleophilia bacterium]
MARGVGVGVLAVGKWERKEALPSRDNRIKLAELFEVDEAVMGVDAADGSAPPSWALALDAKLDAIIGLLEDLPR